MLKNFLVGLLIVGMLLSLGCTVHVHKIGKGAQGNEITEARQWYALYGLVPINDVDTNAMASNAADYEITTETTLFGCCYQCLTNVVTVHCRTVTVEK